ncbi:MAG TPA: alpha/beta hydrolase [Gemmatimonadaceae bacterium]|nr:alpha/beta hydrolase [Gemmatimonadaceae bacterium]
MVPLLAAGGSVSAASCALAGPSLGRVGAAPAAMAAETTSFASASGSTIHAWYSAGRPGGGAVLLLHGVHADRRVMLDRARFLHAAGYAVLIPDFQAHGESPGRHVTFGALESLDAAAALAYVRGRAPAERVGVIGVSMGGAAALVGPGGPIAADAFVLESVYPTIRDATRDRLRAWLGPFGPPLTPALLRVVGGQIGVEPDALRPIERIGGVAAPILLAAGTADRYTTIGESRSLFARATSPKEFWPVEGAGHVDLYAYAPVEYERRVTAFFSRWLRRSSPPAERQAAALTASPSSP